MFHAGTKHEGGELVTSGGRVLGVTALAKDWIEHGLWPTKPACGHFVRGSFFRTDIGAKASSEG